MGLDLVMTMQHLNMAMAVIEEEATLPEITPDLVLAVIYMESRGDPDVEHPPVTEDGVRPVGLMGVVPREAGEDYATRPTAEELKDPKTNITWGIKTLEWFMKRQERNHLQRGLYHYSGSTRWQSFDRFFSKYWLPFVRVRTQIKQRIEEMERDG